MCYRRFCKKFLIQTYRPVVVKVYTGAHETFFGVHEIFRVHETHLGAQEILRLQKKYRVRLSM